MESENKAGSVYEKIVPSFSLYDTFGYLIPGAILVTGYYIFLGIVKVPKEPTADGYLNSIIEDWGIFAKVPVFILLAYILGHFVASIGAVIVDKLLMERTFGYPFRRLFDTVLNWKESDKLRYLHRNETFYKSIIVSLIFLVFFWYIKIHSCRNFFLVTSIFLIVSKFMFSMLCLRDFRNPDSLRNLTDRYLIIANCLWERFFWFILLAFYPLFNLILYTLLYLFRMCKPFEEKIQNNFSKVFEETFKLTLEDAGTNVYWLTYAYLQQSDKKQDVLLIQNWLNLYGFSRNISISFLILFLCGLYPELILENANEVMLKKWCVFTGTAVVVFWLRYYYLYYNYFSKYIFRAFLAQKSDLLSKN